MFYNFRFTKRSRDQSVCVVISSMRSLDSCFVSSPHILRLSSRKGGQNLSPFDLQRKGGYLSHLGAPELMIFPVDPFMEERIWLHSRCARILICVLDCCVLSVSSQTVVSICVACCCNSFLIKFIIAFSNQSMNGIDYSFESSITNQRI